MKIKDVVEQDLDEITRLEREVFKDNAFSRNFFLKYVKNYIFFLKLEKGIFNKKILGFIIVIKDDDERVNIINYLIDSKYQNKGFGTLLLEDTLKKILGLKKFKKIILNVRTTNTIALKIYKKFNFKIVKEINNYYANSQSSYLMKKEIICNE